jgi:hypothetical protein
MAEATSQELQLAPQQYRPSTPIAMELHDHFARGGSVADGVRLVEVLERNGRAVTSSKSKKSAERGTRLSSDWRPSPSDLSFAIERGLPQTRIDTEAEKFRNYWVAKSGTNACKRDWAACWRNWIINAMERGYGPPSYRGKSPGNDFTPGRAPTGSDAILTGMGRLARRVDERRNAAVVSGRQIPNGDHFAKDPDVERRPAR